MEKKKIKRAKIIRLVLVLVLVSLLIIVISRINVISNSTLSQVIDSYYEQSTENHCFNNYIEYTPIGVYIDENNIEMKAEGSAKFKTDAFGNISKVEAVCGSSNLISRFGLNEVTDIFEIESKYRSTIHVTTDIKYIYNINSIGEAKRYDGYYIGYEQLNLRSPSGSYIEGHCEGLKEPCYRIIEAYNLYNNAIKFNSDSYTKIIDGETCTRYVDPNYKNIRINMIKEYNKKINGEDFRVKVLEFKNTKEAGFKPGIIKIYCTKNNEILMIEYENSLLLGVESINNPKEYERCPGEERIIPGFREVNPKNIFK